jgi:hypothetical protein
MHKYPYAWHLSTLNNSQIFQFTSNSAPKFLNRSSKYIRYAFNQPAAASSANDGGSDFTEKQYRHGATGTNSLGFYFYNFFAFSP